MHAKHLDPGPIKDYIRLLSSEMKCWRVAVVLCVGGLWVSVVVNGQISLGRQGWVGQEFQRRKWKGKYAPVCSVSATVGRGLFVHYQGIVVLLPTPQYGKTVSRPDDPPQPPTPQPR